MKALLPLFVALLGFSQVQAKMILISDIDDTLKNSHVLDKSESLLNAGRTQNLLMGMNVAYHAVKRGEPDIGFYYVSNAPRSLMENKHRKFLSSHQFPSGNLRLRPNIFQDDFKLTEIRKILQTEAPSKVILVGDNGERDAAIYAQIEKEYPHLEFATFIHQPYSRLDPEDRGGGLEPGQTGFITSLDLILHLRQLGVVTGADAMSFLRGFHAAFQREDGTAKVGMLAIPAWNDCRDLEWTAPDGDLMLVADYVVTKARILERCSHEALED